jgi:uncharacterized protein YbjT (DUF2867 family)
MSVDRQRVFIAGATGYLGQRLAAELARCGHRVSGLVRPGSERKLPAGCTPLVGNALDAATFQYKFGPADTYVQLVGVAHPSPAKVRQFREIDLVSCEQSVVAAIANQIKHFIYVSVAHPAPAMHAYIEVRSKCEETIRSSGLNATILRPWYVLGPGHYWPYLLKPGYWLARQIPSMRESAMRLGLVTLEQMLAALVQSVESPTIGIRIMEVPEIAKAKLAAAN